MRNKESSIITQLANVVLGLWDPQRYQEETMQFGKSVYDITILRSWFVSAHILKNRNGSTNKRFPFRFLGAVSIFEEFPEHMDQNDYAKLTRY